MSQRARCIRIDIRRSGDVILTLPRGVARAQGYAFLEQRRDWVLRTRARILTRTPPEPALRWDGSDQVLLRGQSLRLEVHEASVRKASVVLDVGRIALYVPVTRLSDTRFLNRLLIDALRDQARVDAKLLLDGESQRLGLSYRDLSIRDQKTRWGSCSRSGHINLNWRLVMAPAEVFRYVVIHELCHLRWLSHGPRFWGLVARQMPEYEMHRAWLRRHGDSLHAMLSEGTSL